MQPLEGSGSGGAVLTLRSALQGVALGASEWFGGLDVISLIGPAPRERDYETLGRGIAAGTVRITETSEGGSVQELAVVNAGPRPVFILDGEELVGARQNRIVNLSVLAAPHTTTVIPVSCVEQGRWSYRSREFTESPNTMHATARAAKAARVNDAMKHGRRDADQRAVWSEVAAMASRRHTQSPTGALNDVYARHAHTLGEYERAFGTTPSQVGVVFALRGRIMGFDLFDAPATLAAYLPKLVRGYALEAMDDPRPSGEEAWKVRSAALRFLELASEATPRCYRGVGIGTDVRLAGGTVAGAALVANGVVVHASGFNVGESGRRSNRHM